jgi:CheY-like chemotaxis protein
VAESSATALAVLEEHPFNLVVIDVQMPVMDGLQLLTLLSRRHPNLQKVVLTGHLAPESYRAACLSGGAELFLQKPRTDAEQRSLYATLNELMRWQPERGFRGVLRRVGLQDVIQMECLARNSLRLEIKAGSELGQIFIREGNVIHAAIGPLKGEAAFHRILALPGGEFATRSFSEPPEQTIDGQWEFLLMEAARQRDESAEEPPKPATVPPEPDLQPLPVSPPAVTPAAVDPPVCQPENPGPPPPAAVGVRDQPAEPGGARSEVADPAPLEEVLICTGQGEILYQWQCRNSEAWVSFLEFVSHKSRRLAQGLELGPFDRLEARTPRSRLVVLVSAQRGILARLGRKSGTVDRSPIP